MLFVVKPGSMLEIKRILVPTDLSPSATAAFHVARNVATRWNAEIHVLYVRNTEALIPGLSRLLGERPSEEEAASFERKIEEQLNGYLEGYEPSVAVQRQGTWPAAEILEHASSARVDLIVMGTHGHRSLEHPALGGTAGDVVRKATMPVLTVRIGDDEPDVFEGFRRVVAAVDFAEHSETIVRAAKNLARRHDAALVMIFVAEEHRVPIFSDTGMMSVTTLKLDEEIVSRSEAALRQLDESTGPSIPETAYEIRRGNPAREIAAFADDRAGDVIVLGRRGHSVHEGLLLGTVTEHIVRRSRCPVMTIGLAEP